MSSAPPAKMMGNRLPLTIPNRQAPAKAIQLYCKLKASFTKFISSRSGGGLAESGEPSKGIRHSLAPGRFRGHGASARERNSAVHETRCAVLIPDHVGDRRAPAGLPLWFPDARS